MEKHMTVKQLKNACDKNKYLLLRYSDGSIIGVNTGVAPLALRRRPCNDDMKTCCIGFTPCDFHTYLTHKVPFLL